MKLGRLGAWYSTDKLGGPAQIREFVGTVERLGYDTLWYPESRGYESFAVAAFMLSCTSKLKLGSSIASIYARDAFTSRRGMITLNDLYGDRFILGLGVSHPPMVEGIRGHTYEKPIPAMRRYLNGIREGEAGADKFPARRCRSWSADAEAVGRNDPGGAALQHQPQAHRRGRENSWPQQMVRDRTKGDAGNRSGEGARARPQGIVPLYGAGQLPQQLGCASASPRPN